MNKRKVQLILKSLNVNPNKRLGQNFLVDQNIVRKIINSSELSNNDVILEIGPGLGAITEKMINSVKKIYAIEIDQRLYTYLKEIYSVYDNIEIIHGDVLEIEIPNHNKCVSNIPYTITGPILQKIFFKQKSPIGILTIEESIADRIFISGNYKTFSRISITVNAFMNPVLKSNISRKSFYPIPKIALCLVKIIPNDQINPFLLNEDSINFFLKFIAGIIPYKNKNIVNSIYQFFNVYKNKKYSKEAILKILQENNYQNKKLFNFKINDLIEISKLIYNLN
jgi:16S rRNA (adenine1518-N6/adenine1519-N6)-dimethyltransferase